MIPFHLNPSKRYGLLDRMDPTTHNIRTTNNLYRLRWKSDNQQSPRIVFVVEVHGEAFNSPSRWLHHITSFVVSILQRLFSPWGKAILNHVVIHYFLHDMIFLHFFITINYLVYSSKQRSIFQVLLEFTHLLQPSSTILFMVDLNLKKKNHTWWNYYYKF